MLPLSLMLALLLPILAELPAASRLPADRRRAERIQGDRAARGGRGALPGARQAIPRPRTYTELGKSAEGRPLPLLVLADPPVRTPRRGRPVGQAGRARHRQHPRRRGLRQGGLADAGTRDPRNASSPPAQGPDHRAGPDLQRRRQRARLEAEPAGPERTRGGDGPAGQCARPRPEPRLHQARGARRPGRSSGSSTPGSRTCSSTRTRPTARIIATRSPTRGRRIPRATRASSRSPGPSSSPRSPASSRRRPVCKPTTTATSTATIRSGRPIRPRDGTA